MQTAPARDASRPARPDERLARRGGAIELLRVPAALFGAGVRLRGLLYDRGWLPRERLDAPVVCAGNLSAGGTGKTPMVAWLARELARRGFRPAIVSRGYGAPRADADAAPPNDEALLLAELAPGVPHVQDADRAAAGRRAIQLGADAIVLDDGFQHRRLARDLDLVLVDATRPWGLPATDGGAPPRAFLPRGLLREPPSSLARAQAIVLTRCDQVEPRALAALADEIGTAAPGVPRVEARHRAVGWRAADGERLPAEAMRGRALDLVSAIGNPDAFERSVRALGASVRSHRRFPDHHRFGAADLVGLGDGGAALACTHKDLVKLRALAPRALALEVEIEFSAGAAVLQALLDSLPRSRSALERAAAHGGLHG